MKQKTLDNAVDSFLYEHLVQEGFWGAIKDAAVAGFKASLNPAADAFKDRRASDAALDQKLAPLHQAHAKAIADATAEHHATFSRTKSETPSPAAQSNKAGFDPSKTMRVDTSPAAWSAAGAAKGVDLKQGLQRKPAAPVASPAATATKTSTFSSMPGYTSTSTSGFNSTTAAVETPKPAAVKITAPKSSTNKKVSSFNSSSGSYKSPAKIDDRPKQDSKKGAATPKSEPVKVAAPAPKPAAPAQQAPTPPVPPSSPAAEVETLANYGHTTGASRSTRISTPPKSEPVKVAAPKSETPAAKVQGLLANPAPVKTEPAPRLKELRQKYPLGVKAEARKKELTTAIDQFTTGAARVQAGMAQFKRQRAVVTDMQDARKSGKRSLDPDLVKPSTRRGHPNF